MNIWVIFGFLIFLAIWLVQGYLRAKQIHMLVERGQPTHGVIVTKRSFRGSAHNRRRMVVYVYNVDGEVRKARTTVSAEEYRSLNEGQSIAVRYLPEQPNISAPESVVEEGRWAKAALRKQ